MSYSSLFSVWITMIFCFCLAYFGFSFIEHHGLNNIQSHTPFYRLFDSLYFSIITATSTGYGDITPLGFSKVLASLQSMSALFIFATFVTKLVSHQQEITLQEVHRLTFEDVVHNTREGLFLCRKDLDRVIQAAEKHNILSEEHWHDMTFAYKQMQSLLRDIPEFYAHDAHRYTIDETREQLLLEAVHRSVHRINTMLDTLSAQGIAWWMHKESTKELTSLVYTIESVTPLWQERSPYALHEAFEDIIHLKNNVHKCIECALKNT